jgi:glycosyltransferase involved in cell wall biosynthesis
MSGALVSCLIPAYNHEAFVADAVTSVLGPGDPRVTAIAVDDCSADGTHAVLVALSERFQQLTVLRNESNRGAARTVQRAAAEATTPFLTTLASDDRWLPGRLNNQLPVMEAGADWSFGPAHVIDAAGRRTSSEPQGPPPETDGMMRTLLRGQAIYAPTLMYRRSFYDSVGGVADAMWEDLATTLRFAAVSEPVFVTQPLVEYRVHDANLHLGLLAAKRHVHAHAQAVRLLQEWPRLPPSARQIADSYAAAWRALEELVDSGRPKLRGVPADELSRVVRRQSKDLLRDIDPDVLRRFEIALWRHGARDGARAIGELRGPLLLRARRKLMRQLSVRR